MINIVKFLKNDTGRLLLSVLLGLGLSAMFRTICKGNKCVIFKAPNIKEYQNKIYKYNNKCYKYSTQATKCDKSKRIIPF